MSKIKPLPKGAHLVTMDVRSLYTSIPNEEGLQAVEQTLMESNRQEEIPVVLKLLNQVLTLNNFVFNDEHFLQIKGCAMGTTCAPSCANIFMGRFESERIYPKIESIIQSYLRYFDDVFLIWTGSKEKFERFVEELN